MKIAFTDDPGSSYGVDLLVSGLLDVLGPGGVDFFPLFDRRTGPEAFPTGMGARAGAGGFRAAEASRFVEALRSGVYSAVVVWRRAAPHLPAEVKEAISATGRAVVLDQEDGRDRDVLTRAGARAVLGVDVRLGFCREMTSDVDLSDGPDGQVVYPLAFCAAALDAPPERKVHDVGFVWAPSSFMRKRVGDWMAVLEILHDLDVHRRETAVEVRVVRDGAEAAIPLPDSDDARAILATEWERDAPKIAVRDHFAACRSAQRGGRDLNAPDPFDRGYVSHADYIREIRRSKIGLSVGGGGWQTVRYFEIPAAGVFMMSDHPQVWIESNFEPAEPGSGKGHVSFFSLNDRRGFERQLLYWLSHDDEREAVAARAREHALRFHLPACRARAFLGRILEVFGSLPSLADRYMPAFREARRRALEGGNSLKP